MFRTSDSFFFDGHRFKRRLAFEAAEVIGPTASASVVVGSEANNVDQDRCGGTFNSQVGIIFKNSTEVAFALLTKPAAAPGSNFPRIFLTSTA